MVFNSYDEFISYILTVYNPCDYEMTPLHLPWCSTRSASDSQNATINTNSISNLDLKDENFSNALNFHNYFYSSKNGKRKRKVVRNKKYMTSNILQPIVAISTESTHLETNISYPNQEHYKNCLDSENSVEIESPIVANFCTVDNAPLPVAFDYLEDENHVAQYEFKIRDLPLYACTCCDIFLFSNQTRKLKQHMKIMGYVFRNNHFVEHVPK